MVRDGVIELVSEPSDWVNSIVVVEKANKKDVRICLDPRDLNKYIKREHYPMKTVEEVAAMVDGASVFSVCDASSGFWQISLREDCTNLTVFNTPFGRYKFLRMPFGLSSSPEVWQKMYVSYTRMWKGVQSSQTSYKCGVVTLRNIIRDYGLCYRKLETRILN